MTIPFSAFFGRLCEATGIATQMDLARALGVNRSAITQAKVRDAVPQKWILALARHYSLSADWLEFGKGPLRHGPFQSDQMQPGQSLPSQSLPSQSLPDRMRPAQGLPGKKTVPGVVAGGLLRPIAAPGDVHEELVYVPRASARLCAGGGSFEVDAAIVGTHPMPFRWLSRLGSPSHMVFMDVVGDSMEPGIMDGDTVLIDRANTRYADGGVLAVGVDDAIYLKRMEKTNNGVLLHSDNEAYTPMNIYGDEIDSLRVIGKVVWLCRDCV